MRLFEDYLNARISVDILYIVTKSDASLSLTIMIGNESDVFAVAINKLTVI